MYIHIYIYIYIHIYIYIYIHIYIYIYIYIYIHIHIYGGQHVYLWLIYMIISCYTGCDIRICSLVYLLDLATSGTDIQYTNHPSLGLDPYSLWYITCSYPGKFRISGICGKNGKMCGIYCKKRNLHNSAVKCGIASLVRI